MVFKTPISQNSGRQCTPFEIGFAVLLTRIETYTNPALINLLFRVLLYGRLSPKASLYHKGVQSTWLFGIMHNELMF